MKRLTTKIGNHVEFPTALVGKTVLPDNELMYQLLTALAEYEDKVERAEKIMPLADIERVLKGGQWREEMINYINDCYDGDFPDWETDLNKAIDAVMEFIETTHNR